MSVCDKQVDLVPHRRSRRCESQRQACELGLGTRVQWNGGVLLIERIRVEPTRAIVTVVADGGEVTFQWNEVVDVVDV